MLSNTLANIPATALKGTLFVATDTFALYRYDGSTWALIGGPGTGTITGSGTANQVAYFTASGVIASSNNLQFNGTTLTAANDIVVNGLFIGRGGGNIVGNSALGLLALELNTTGQALTALGNAALRNNTTGSNSVAIGTNALLQSNADFNTAIGAFAAPSATGANNTAIGAQTLQFLFGGSDNTAIGYFAGSGTNATQTGTQNVFIGALTTSASASASNQIVIGYGAASNGSNTVTIGNSSVTDNYFSGNVRGAAFIPTGGTSSQFLKGDGSLDGISYATAASLSGYLPLSGGTLTGELSGTTAQFNSANITAFSQTYKLPLTVLNTDATLNKNFSIYINTNASGVTNYTMPTGSDYIGVIFYFAKTIYPAPDLILNGNFLVNGNVNTQEFITAFSNMVAYVFDGTYWIKMS